MEFFGCIGCKMSYHALSSFLDGLLEESLPRELELAGQCRLKGSRGIIFSTKKKEKVE
jgi:hypothetical protein